MIRGRLGPEIDATQTLAHYHAWVVCTIKPKMEAQIYFMARNTNNSSAYRRYHMRVILVLLTLACS